MFEIFDYLIQKKLLKIYTNISVYFYIVFFIFTKFYRDKRSFKTVSKLLKEMMSDKSSLFSDRVKRRKSSMPRKTFPSRDPQFDARILHFCLYKVQVGTTYDFLFELVRVRTSTRNVKVRTFEGCSYDRRTMSPGEKLLLVIWFGMHAKITICGS